MNRKSEPVGARRLARIHDALQDRYGAVPRHRGQADILGGLVRTILSQSTSDANSGRAYRALRDRFADWAAVRDAPPGEVEDVLRPAGLAPTKTRRIQTILRAIAPEGPVDLEPLWELDDEAAERYLCGFEGIGPKTARCVLLFEMGRDMFPMDTHIFRVLRRVGMLPPGLTGVRAHACMDALVPEGRALSLHVLLIRHGRTLCRPRDPRCGDCPIRPWCDYGRS
jgi:endonuclease-3